MSIEKLSPFEASLRDLAARASKVTADPEDKDSVALSKKIRLELRTARVEIEKVAKSLRDVATGFQRKVSSKEKELIAIVEVEEVRLKAIEDEAKRLVELSVRREDLPRRQRLLAPLDIAISDESLLEMSGDQFNDFFARETEKNSAKVESERIAREEEFMRREEELQRREREAIEAKEKAEREIMIREEERLRVEAENARKKAEAEKAEAEKQKKLEKQEAYRQYRASLGWTEENRGEFKEERVGETVVIWKKAGEFELN